MNYAICEICGALHDASSLAHEAWHEQMNEFFQKVGNFVNENQDYI